jgi:hypothetical protein
VLLCELGYAEAGRHWDLELGQLAAVGVVLGRVVGRAVVTLVLG